MIAVTVPALASLAKVNVSVATTSHVLEKAGSDNLDDRARQ
jgi:hypothetical protein